MRSVAPRCRAICSARRARRRTSVQCWPPARRSKSRRRLLPDAFSSREPVPTSLENALFALAAAVVGLAEAGSLRIFLRTEPALGIVQAGIRAAALQMVDADIACHARPHGVFALDGTAGRHQRVG